MGKVSIELIGESKCTGCMACVAVCPTGALKMIENNDGFLIPKFNRSKCINCNSCSLVCPVVKRNETHSFNSPLCFAAWSKSEKNIENSSSGGIFMHLAEEIIKEGGYVSGVVMDGFRAKHIMSKDIEEIKMMRGSKYIQSQTLGVFKRFYSDGHDNTMFFGTPCQVAALRNILKKSNRDQEKYLFCDIACHGVPSFKILDSYLRSLEVTDGRSVQIKFRDKKYGWENYSFLLRSNSKTIVHEDKNCSSYLRTFLSDIALRESCYNCQFASIPRQGDITLADYWGVPKEMRNKNGVSAVLLNTNKGRDFFMDACKPGSIVFHKATLADIALSNKRLVSGKSPKPLLRKFFLKNLSSDDYQKMYRFYVKPVIFKNKINIFLTKKRSIKKIINRYLKT